ncbi:unnamed protein product [Arabidopsis thaliana]|uniref:Trimethylguanosine synthase n=1 Tax=Arabidopsis thaliana TaxID=3702 RepID=A0A7G2DVT3_ARATH|nr:unnamed protein product [Arabidopsis thaliana]
MGKVRGEVEEAEGEAIEALGSLFKLTQIHLWVDTDTPLFHQHSGNKSVDDTYGIANNGLMKEMNDLGLPVSFRTNKQWKNRTRGYQKKGFKDRLDEEVNVILKVEDTLNLVSALNEEVESPCFEEDCVQVIEVEEENHEVVVGSCFLGNGDGDSVLASETIDSHDSSVWKVYWDSFYGRSYFYNFKTQESKWEPPLGMEHLAYSDESHNLSELVIEVIEIDLCLFYLSSDDLGGVCQSQLEAEATEEVNSLIDTYQETSIGNQSLDITSLGEEGTGAYVVSSVRKAKKESRRSRAKKKLLNSYTGTEMKGVPEEYSPILGVGGNAIQFASRSHYVIAIDLDPKKLDLAKHNAAIYGVADKIDFVKGDFFDLAHNLKAGTVFLSPPWGGPDYLKASTYDMKTMLRPRDGDALFKAAMNIASTIIMFLPRNVDINQLAELALSTSPPWSLEAKKNYLNGKLKAVTAYYVRQDDCKKLKRRPQ